MQRSSPRRSDAGGRHDNFTVREIGIDAVHPPLVTCLGCKRVKRTASRRTSYSTSFADAFDLFIDLRILRIFRPDGVVALRRWSLSYGAVDPTSRRSASGIARCSDRCRTHWGASGAGCRSRRISCPGRIGARDIGRLRRVAPLGSLPELLRPPTLAGPVAPSAVLAPAEPTPCAPAGDEAAPAAAAPDDAPPADPPPAPPAPPPCARADVGDRRAATRSNLHENR